jgi:F0F1-type ATP synthase assembly protein I
MESDDHKVAEEAGKRAATAIQIGSLVKSLCFAVFLVVAVVVFNMDVFAALIGFSLTVVSTIAGPLFVKTEPADEEPEHSEVEKEC